ncbi:MAG: hypothetical protein ABSH34_15610, partial [Verrucomicrobiota bacterium]
WSEPLPLDKTQPILPRSGHPKCPNSSGRPEVCPTLPPEQLLPREYTWTFDGGMAVPASPSPHVVPAPWSNGASVDPEEAFVAVVASCHMLTFVWLASRAGFVADRYEDEAVGVMSKNERGAWWVSTVTLRPRIV